MVKKFNVATLHTIQPTYNQSVRWSWVYFSFSNKTETARTDDVIFDEVSNDDTKIRFFSFFCCFLISKTRFILVFCTVYSSALHSRPEMYVLTSLLFSFFFFIDCARVLQIVGYDRKLTSFFPPFFYFHHSLPPHYRFLRMQQRSLRYTYVSRNRLKLSLLQQGSSYLDYKREKISENFKTNQKGSSLHGSTFFEFVIQSPYIRNCT